MKFGFCMANFESIEWPDLIPLLHTSYPRFSFFVEDLVVVCNNVTELGRARYVAFWIASASCSCNFRTLESLANCILEKCVNKLCFPFGGLAGAGSG